jgi:hypothetical protein
VGEEVSIEENVDELSKLLYGARLVDLVAHHKFRDEVVIYITDRGLGPLLEVLRLGIEARNGKKTDTEGPQDEGRNHPTNES